MEVGKEFLIPLEVFHNLPPYDLLFCDFRPPTQERPLAIHCKLINMAAIEIGDTINRLPCRTYAARQLAWVMAKVMGQWLAMGSNISPSLICPCLSFYNVILIPLQGWKFTEENQGGKYELINSKHEGVVTRLNQRSIMDVQSAQPRTPAALIENHSSDSHFVTESFSTIIPSLPCTTPEPIAFAHVPCPPHSQLRLPYSWHKSTSKISARNIQYPHIPKILG